MDDGKAFSRLLPTSGAFRGWMFEMGRRPDANARVSSSVHDFPKIMGANLGTTIDAMKFLDEDPSRVAGSWKAWLLPFGAFATRAVSRYFRTRAAFALVMALVWEVLLTPFRSESAMQLRKLGDLLTGMKRT